MLCHAEPTREWSFPHPEPMIHPHHHLQIERAFACLLIHDRCLVIESPYQNHFHRHESPSNNDLLSPKERPERVLPLHAWLHSLMLPDKCGITPVPVMEVSRSNPFRVR